MVYDGSTINRKKFVEHQCPYCAHLLAFYRIKESKKYFWEECMYCGFAPRTEKVSKEEAEKRAAEKIKNSQLNIFNHEKNMQS